MTRRLSAAVRRIGFRKWYERELLAGHAHMVLGFLAAIAVTGSVEAYRTGAADAGLYALFIVVCAAIGAWALKRYSYLLMRAEEVANQASCPACSDYGRFQVVHERPAAGELGVRCSKCGHDWVIGGLLN
jgi:predicted Zn finger-like uncharacterized protein